MRVGRDSFGRGALTVFYRDSSVGDGREVFYLWAEHWRASYPAVPVPPEGYDTEPTPAPRRGPCVPYVLDPAHPERLCNLITTWRR